MLRILRLCCCLGVGIACATALGGEFTGRVPVRAPDVFGGWASTHVIVRVVEGIEPQQLRDGSWTFTGPAEADLAQVLADWDVSDITATAHPAPANTALAHALGLDRYYTIHVPAGSDTPTLVQRLTAFSDVFETVELDGVGGILQTFPDDPAFGNQYALHNTGQNINGQVGTEDADIDAPEAWDITTGSADVIIAIIDSGVSHSHPDLASKLVAGYNTYDDNNDADDSWFISHGTHCAGIAAAISNNGTGIAGVCWNARIMPVKVLSDFGSGTESQCANGVIWAADHGANVGSMSLGYTEGTSYFHDAITYAYQSGMVLTVATGNTPGAQIFYPAIWPETIAVGATDNQDNLADFTTTGPEMSVTAPGVDVYSCWDTLLNPDTYVYESGTSMACPHVAGLAALVWSANPALTNDEVRFIIESNADDLGTPGWDENFGWGRINAYRAVLAASGGSQEGDVDGDGDVDLQDLSLLLAAYNTCEGDSGYNPAADFTGDGCVGLADLAVLLANYGR